jgi:hypothetical protein
MSANAAQSLKLPKLKDIPYSFIKHDNVVFIRLITRAHVTTSSNGLRCIQPVMPFLQSLIRQTLPKR